MLFFQKHVSTVSCRCSPDEEGPNSVTSQAGTNPSELTESSEEPIQDSKTCSSVEDASAAPADEQSKTGLEEEDDILEGRKTVCVCAFLCFLTFFKKLSSSWYVFQMKMKIYVLQWLAHQALS